jgi:hypothetical protein
MGYRNQFDYTGQNQISGETAEAIFESVAKKRNFAIQKATMKQQYAHIDFILTDNQKNKTYLIDVKARKKISRHQKDFQDELIWIEFKNVLGNNGWLFGSADFIAFERQNDFVLVARKNLITLCEKIVKKEKATNPADALYKTFSRKTRKDELSLIKMDDILSSTKTFIWPKEQQK